MTNFAGCCSCCAIAAYAAPRAALAHRLAACERDGERVRCPRYDESIACPASGAGVAPACALVARCRAGACATAPK